MKRSMTNNVLVDIGTFGKQSLSYSVKARVHVASCLLHKYFDNVFNILIAAVLRKSDSQTSLLYIYFC